MAQLIKYLNEHEKLDIAAHPYSPSVETNGSKDESRSLRFTERFSKNKHGETLGKDTLIYRPLASTDTCTHIHTPPHNTHFPASPTKKAEEVIQSF